MKTNYPGECIAQLSDKIIKRLEDIPCFKQAHTIAVYHALPDEVQTADLIEKWFRKKNILLPVLTGNKMSLQLYLGNDSLKIGNYGILEPTTGYTEIKPDLIIVPGLAFDHQRNRLGRGKGYYDSLLSDITIPTIGICFHFQLFDKIPTEKHDKKMSLIITDRETI